MEDTGSNVLQEKLIESSEEASERLDIIPYLLFVLILVVSYFGVIQFQQQRLALFLILAALNVGFLCFCIRLARKLRQSKQAEAESGSQLGSAQQQLAQRDQRLGEATDTVANTEKALTATREELAQANELFDNYSLQLEITTSELKATKSESEAILANVKQGVFLIGHDGTIGRQFSEELKKIFQIEEIASRNFIHVLRPLIPEKRYQTISNYIELLFNVRKNEKQLQRFNPLKCVELNFQRPEGGFAPKNVEFNFQRVFNGEKINRVLVTAVDVSERVQLETRLREGEERREKQLELLCDLLNAETAQLRGFLNDAAAVIDEVNGTFRAASAETVQKETAQEKVSRVFRLVHKLKSQAASLKLQLFEHEIHQMEDLLNDVRRNPQASNEDLLNILVAISHFQGRLKEAGALIEKISGLRRSFGAEGQAAGETAARNTPSTELMRAAEDLCRTVATRSGKKARIEWIVNGFDELPLAYRGALRDAVFQLVRNAVTHGIELPEAREARRKDPCGLITLTIKPVAECHAVHLSCHDDGAGLDIEAIRNRAVREGMVSEDAARTLPENSLYAMIFEPGFSTASAVSEDAGRGVGLDALHDTISRQFKGEIQLEFGAGRYCQFELLVPLP